MFRRILGALGSSAFATWLLIFVGGWSAVASAVPQGDSSSEVVALWASAHPAVETVARLLGLHNAFTSPVFLGAALGLGVSMALCSSRRTKVAWKRTRLLRQASSATVETLAEDHEYEITCAPGLTEEEVRAATVEILDELGISTKNRDGLLSGVSAPWTVWGSPVFHWALLALMVLFVIGALQRSEGLMGLAVGETKADAPQSYGYLKSGPLYDWGRVRRAVRLDAFESSYVLDGMDRGPTPTVSLLDGDGNVVKKQRIYPNMPLRSGTLTVHNSDYGLAVRVSVRDSAGVQTASRILLVDFSEEGPQGTRSVGFIPLSTADGSQRLRVSATVPLDLYEGQFTRWLPTEPTARVVVTSDAGKPILERVLAPGEELALPIGASIRMEDIGVYSRLSVVDDWTIPFVYAAMALAIIGLTATLASRQQLVLVAVVGEPGQLRVVARLRFWRNVPADIREVRDLLNARLLIDQEGIVS